MATTAVYTVFQDTGETDRQNSPGAAPGAACGGASVLPTRICVAILMRNTCSGRRASCPSQRQRSTPRCCDAPRRTRTPSRRSTAPRSETINAAHQGLRRRGQRRHHPVLHRRRGVRLRARGQGHGHRRGGAGRVRPRRRRQVPDQRRAAHRPLPEGQAGHLRAAAAGDLGRAGRGRQEPAVPVAHVGRLGGADRREPGDRAGAAEAGGRGQDHPGDRDRRGGRRGGRRRGRDQRQALHHPRGLREDHRRAGPRRARQVPAGRDVRQRARRLQAGQRQAAPRHPGPGPEGGRRPSWAWPTAPSRSTSSSTAVRAR